MLARLFTILLYVPPIIACVYLGGLPFMIMMLMAAFVSLQEMYHMFQLRSGKWHDIFYIGYMVTAMLFITVYMKEMKFIWNYTLLGIVLSAVFFFIKEFNRIPECRLRIIIPGCLLTICGDNINNEERQQHNNNYLHISTCFS